MGLMLNGKRVIGGGGVPLIIDSITMRGTWLASGTVTMPAFTMGGDIVPANDNERKIGSATKGLLGIYTAHHYIFSHTTEDVYIRNKANTALRNLGIGTLKFGTSLSALGDGNISTRDNTAGYIAMKGFGSGAHVEHARLAPNNFELKNGLLTGKFLGNFQEAESLGKVSFGTATTGATKLVEVNPAGLFDCLHSGILFDVAALTDECDVWTQPARTVLVAVRGYLITQFAAPDMTSLIFTIGDATDPDGLLEADAEMDLLTNADDTKYEQRGAYWNTPGVGGFYYADVAKTWRAYSTAVDANLNTTTAGRLCIFFTYIQL